ncbi:MAG: GTP pyrophosphokinase family protein [Ruminiclostridium sp.]|nr:GTP pyrophosphokinase family protein [Ruminiclostridium sp.]
MQTDRKNDFDIIVASFENETDLQQMYNQYSTLMAYFRCAIMEIQTKFNVLNEEFSLQHDRNPINSIQSRLKSIESISRKLNNKGIPLTISNIEENLSDVAGVRVVCAFTSDVYLLAKALLAQDDIKLVSIKDYIKNPKPNGYRSLHLIVTVPIFLVREKRIMTVEIQLRTIAMDSWAALEHQLKYKKDNEFTDDMIKELYHCAKISSELDEKMDKLRGSVYEEEPEYSLKEFEEKMIVV